MKGKKGRKSKFFYRQKIMADMYGNEAIRTKWEYLFEGFLREAQLPFEVNQIFCFTCKRYYPYNDRDLPEKCHYCRISFKKADKNGEKGHLSRPDFLIDMNHVVDVGNGILKGHDMKKLAVIRVDGNIHKEKSVSLADHFILENFLELGVKVFIIRNEDLWVKTIPEIKQMVENIKLMIKDNDLYEKYKKSKEFEELTYCPFLEIRRYNKNKK